MSLTISPGSRRLVKLLGLILTATALSGCMTSSAGQTDYCLIAGPIYFSDLDTPETVSQIVKHNSDYLCACKDDCA